MLTTEEQIQKLKLQLIILKSEIDLYLKGEWVPEYHLTIAYNRVYTGRKVYRYNKS